MKLVSIGLSFKKIKLVYDIFIVEQILLLLIKNWKKIL